MPYTTRQQQAVLSCLHAHRGGCVTALELADMLRRQDIPVGLATVYRQLERLAVQGQVHRISTEDGVCYQLCDHPGGNCFLLKCERCGCIQHLDCARLRPLYQHLEEEHRFTINPRKTLLYGLCGLCTEKEEAQ